MPGFGPEAHIWCSLNQYRFCISLSSSLRHWKLNSTIFLSCLCCAVKTDMYYSLWWTCCFFLHIHFYINLAQLHSPTYSTNSRHASVTELKWKIAYRPSAWKSITKNYPFELGTMNRRSLLTIKPECILHSSFTLSLLQS